MKNDPIINVAIQHSERPSWRRQGEGTAEVRLMRHTAAKWVSLTVSESYMGEESRRLVTRASSMTLHGEEITRALDAIAPGLVKSAMIAAEILRGLYRDAHDAEALRNLDEALAVLAVPLAPATKSAD